ncbi:hypothetical protein, conserved [Plasmodium malariae]|uniref:Uncharacterized protein n=1 Tax=Plasmodium malariae TaxID=5858 RepID=A0A1A8W278_PLAMA|nr:hypothetical protein, conserved [Plasmodium malariae]
MMQKAPKTLRIDFYYIIINCKFKKQWHESIFKKEYLHQLSKINHSFVHKSKYINKNIYNMKCIELYRYSCLLEKQSVNNVAIYKQINRRVEMIYKFLNPSKIVLLIKLYLENANLNLYHSTFNCLLEEAIKKLNEFNLEEIVKLYNIISNVENNQNVVYLFKYFNNHLINYYTFIDVKSFSVLLNSHAKLKIKDMKLINKFLHIIMQNKLPFDVITYSIFFNSFYKLRIVDNEFVTIIVRQFLNEIDESKEKEDSVRIEKFDQNIVHNDKKKTIRNIFVSYSPYHICNILLYFTIYNINNIANLNDLKEFKNDLNLSDNVYINFLIDLLIKKKNLLKCEEILTLCQVFKSLKIKNNILVNHIENLLLNYFIYVKDQKNINYNNNNQNVTNSTDFIPFTDNALVKILFDMCTFYNDINIYNYSIQYFRWKKVDFYASSLLLYIYTEINLLDYQMITILIHVINKNYLLNFQVENIFPIIRSFYKICLNNQHYFESTNKSQNFANNMQNCSETTRHSCNSQPTLQIVHSLSSDTYNSITQDRKLSSTCKIPQNEMYNKINDNAKAIALSANDNPIKTSTQIGYIFCKIENLCDNIFSKLKKELLEKKIHISRSNISLLCKILFYSTFLRRFAFLNNVINLFIDKKDELESFKNILNILYAYCYIKNNIYSYDINKINLIKVNEKSIIKQHTNDRVLENYNFIINKLNHNNELTNMISFLFIQCKLNDYRFVNEESITTWLKFSFLNIHLLSLLLNSLISKELNIITNFTANDRTEILLETIGNKKKGNDIKNSHIIVKNVYKLHLMKLYNLILVQINKLILKCQNVYDITRIFNSSFIFLSYFGKLKNEQKLNGEDLQVQTSIYNILRKIEKNVIQNYLLYNKEYIILLSAICIYSNNYSYIPFAFFFQYFHLFAFKEIISYLILLSNDEEIKYISNSIFSLINYKSTESIECNKKEDIEKFYFFHVSKIVRSISTNRNNDTKDINNHNNDNPYDVNYLRGHVQANNSFCLNPFQINNIISIYKSLISNNDILNSEFFKKIKDLYLHSIEINSALLNNLSLSDLNSLCLFILKKNNVNTFLFKYILKKNYEYIDSEKKLLLKYDYIISLLKITIHLRKYNLFINDSIIINIILKNVDKFNTLHKMNTLIECLLQIRRRNTFDNLINELCYNSKNMYLNYFLSNQTVDLNIVLYFLYILNSFNNSELFYTMFQIFCVKLFHLKRIVVYQRKRYNFVSSSNNTFFMAKNIYYLNIDGGIKLAEDSDDPFRDVSTSDNEYVIYVNDENAFINMENKETKEEEEEEEEEFNDDHHDEKDESKMELEISNSKKITVTAKSSKNDMQLVMQNKETDKDTHLSNYHKETNQIKNIKKMDHTTHINDHSFIILFLLLDLVKNEQRIKQAEIYNFNFSLFKNYIYILNKEVIIQCLYIYFYSEINEKLEHDNKLRGNRVIDEHVHYILNVLITFIHNLDVYSILKLSFIYINLYLYSNKKYQVNENIKILFEHINKKKNLIEKNNILYEQIKRYENISNL